LHQIPGDRKWKRRGKWEGEKRMDKFEEKRVGEFIINFED